MNRALLLMLAMLSSASAQAQQNNQQEVLPPQLIQNSDLADEGDKISDKELQQMLFEQLLKNNNLLTPQQRALIHDMERKKVEAIKRQKPAEPINEIIPVTFKPGSHVKSVFVTPGFDTHLTFIDATGAPWPVTYVSGGSDEDFPIKEVSQGTGDSKRSNVVKVNSVYRVGSTNLTVMLDGLNEIVNVNIIADELAYHPVATMQVHQNGPNARFDALPGIPPISNDRELKLILQGGVGLPKSFERLEASNPEIDAWLDTKSGDLFLLTNHVLRSPRPVGIHPGTGGYIAYRTSFLPAITLNTSNGYELTVTLREGK